ncbi:MAG: HAD-IIA family hydrolase [Acidimicrobiia bacterium]
MPSTQPVVLCDLDGVVWLGGEALPGAAEAVRRLRAAGAVAFLTNNSSQPVAGYVRALERVGIDAAAAEVATSAQAAAGFLAGVLAPGARVLACAGEGVAEALSGHGFGVVAGGDCDAVVVGWHRHFDFDRLAAAAAAVRAGARFVATNLDPTYPAPDGLLPGNGALVAAVATAAGRQPEVAGKPYPPTVAMVRARFGDKGIVVGDRPSTDGALAHALGWPFALVVSEATRSADESAAAPADHVGPSLLALTDVIAGVLRRGDKTH